MDLVPRGVLVSGGHLRPHGHKICGMHRAEHGARGGGGESRAVGRHALTGFATQGKLDRGDRSDFVRDHLLGRLKKSWSGSSEDS